MVGFALVKRGTMFNLILVPHQDLSQINLDEIIQVKSIAWPYRYEEQLEWLNSNLKDTDIHVLLYLDKSLVAYLNLIEIEFTVDGYLENGYGIGNVCAKEKGKGWGKKLITETNTYLTQNDKIGVLFCKDSLANFYIQQNWTVIEKQKIALAFNNESIETMIFNYDYDFLRLVYSGKPF